MKEQYENIGVLAQFTFGILSAVVFDFFIRDHVILGVATGASVTLSAIYVSSDDVQNEIKGLKNIPRNIALAASDVGTEVKNLPALMKEDLAIVQLFIEERLQKALREMRQKKLLRRNRIYRTRRVLAT